MGGRLRRINGVEALEGGAGRRDVCWICDGWQQVTFEWHPGRSGTMASEPVYLHLDFEEYRPILMAKGPECFYLVRMCPPNRKVHYFFSNPVLGV